MPTWEIVVLLLMVGLLPVLLSKLIKAPPKGAIPSLPLSPYRLVRCDCGADTKCPQGRNPQSGDPYRCQIWKSEKLK